MKEGKDMTVSELIRFLQQQPQDIQVAIRMYSEQALLDVDEITVGKACKPRHEDGWVQNWRPDKEAQTYLIFPGN